MYMYVRKSDGEEENELVLAMWSFLRQGQEVSHTLPLTVVRSIDGGGAPLPRGSHV